MLRFVLRRSLRGGGSGLSFLSHGPATASPILTSAVRLLRFSSLSSNSNTSKYTFAWEEPFEDGGDLEQTPLLSTGELKAASHDEEVGNGTVQTGKLGRELVKLGPDEPVTPMLQQWLDDGNSMPKSAGVIALTNLKRLRRYKQALEVADFVWSKRPYEMDAIDHMYRLYLTGQVGTVKDVERCFGEIPAEHTDERVYNQLMSCYIARGMMTEAENALKRLINSGHQVSSLPYSQFLALYSHQQEFDKALNLVKEMIAAKTPLDTRTFNIFLSLTLREGAPEKVLSLFDTMTDAGVTSDSFTHSLIVKAYLALGKEKEAYQVAHAMMKDGVEEKVLAQDLLLAVYADLGKEDQVKKLWSRIVKTSTNVSARSYGVMIESLGKLGLVEEAEELAKKAEKRKGKFVARLFNALLEVYARHGRMEAAEELMARVTTERLRPTSVTYKHLISGHLNVGQLDKALEYLKTSRDCLTYDHSKPWLVSFLLVLDHIARKGDVERAEQLFDTFTATGPYRTTVVYNILLKAYVKAKRTPQDFVQRMANDGLQPDSKTLDMLSQIEAHSNGGQT